MSPRRWYLFPIGLWAATRLGLLLLATVSVSVVPQMDRPGASTALKQYPALDALCRWDCGWFERIAHAGYDEPEVTNVWPGLPLAVRGLAWATGLPIELCLLLIPNLACLGAYLVLYRLWARIDGDSAARWALLLFAAFPFAFFHAAGYAETLMILFSALAVRLALVGRHFWAGAALGIGVLCRHVTILLGGALLVAQLRERGFRGLLRNRQVLALLLPFVMVGAYMAWQWKRFGDPFAFWKARGAWGGAYAWWTLVDVVKNAEGYPHVAALPVFALVPTVGAVALATRARTAELAAAALPFVLVLWTTGLFGLGRFAASCWPAFLPLGGWLARRPGLQAPALLVLALAQGWFFFMHSHHFEIQ